MEIKGLDEFMSQFPVFEYRIISTDRLRFEERVRYICEHECERYHTTWACPPGVGTLEECQRHCQSYSYGLIFSSVSEAQDLMDMEELLSYRGQHEQITNQIGDFMEEQGYEIFILSTESCDICEECTYPDAPCRNPHRMHPCLESQGIVVSEIAEREGMEFNLGGNTVLWFSMILFRS